MPTMNSAMTTTMPTGCIAIMASTITTPSCGMYVSDGTTPGMIPGMDGMAPITVSAGVHGTAGDGAGDTITPDGAMDGVLDGTTAGNPLLIVPIALAAAHWPTVAIVQVQAWRADRM